MQTHAEYFLRNDVDIRFVKDSVNLCIVGCDAVSIMLSSRIFDSGKYDDAAMFSPHQPSIRCCAGADDLLVAIFDCTSLCKYSIMPNSCCCVFELQPPLPSLVSRSTEPVTISIRTCSMRFSQASVRCKRLYRNFVLKIPNPKLLSKRRKMSTDTAHNTITFDDNKTQNGKHKISLLYSEPPQCY